MIRPQKKRDKETREMRDALKPGDEILTIGGIKGKIVRIKDDTVTIAVGSDKVKLDFVKSAIGTVINKDQKASDSSSEKAEKINAKPDDDTKKPDRNKKIRPKKLGKEKDLDEESSNKEDK